MKLNRMVSYMDKRMKQISQEIQKGRNLEQNIPQLFNSMANQYQVVAEVRLAMHYFTFYEAYYDDENTWSKEALSYIDQVNGIIHDNIVENKAGTDREKAIVKIHSIRKDIMKHMEALISYTDMFQIYEYVLNRIEYRFKEEAEYVDDEEFAKDILRFIFDSDDNFIINEKIKDIVGQLPIRITKQKYFELINDSFKSYLGAAASSLESFLYMLRTSAMLNSGDEMGILYPELWEKKEQLAQMDYQNMTRELFDKAKSTLRIASLTLETETSAYYGLQEIINDAYALLLCTPYAGMAITDDTTTDNARKAAQRIITDINVIFATKEKKDVFDEVMEHFTGLEGVQEELAFGVDSMESAFFEITQNSKDLVESLILNPVMNVLVRSQSLLSNSLFVDFDESEDVIMVSESKLANAARQLERDMTELFSKQDRILTRAIMANTMNKLPVFFKDHKEVMDYVRYSLERCSDIHEKIACIEIIRDIMSE